jgi:phosphatidylethanolamine-binding protein
VIDPDKTLLVIIDMQNFFVHPVFREHTEGLKTIEPLIRVIEKCRRERIEVCWLNWGITDQDLKAMPPAVTRGFNKALAHEKGHGWHVGLGKTLPKEQGGERCLFKGVWNADIYDPLQPHVRPEDHRFDKARMSGLWSPELPMHKWLRKSMTTLLFAGVNTDQCVLSTLTDAYNWGWDCILIGDCAGTMTSVLGAKEVCDYNVATNMGFVTDSESFCQAKIA